MSLSTLVGAASNGAFVTITRHGKPVAAFVPLKAAGIACKAHKPKRTGLVGYLETFPGGAFQRNPAGSRDAGL